MAYGAGRSHLIAERGREQAKEHRLYEKQLKKATRSRRIEDKRKGAWGFLFGAPGEWLADTFGTVGGKQAEDYKIDVDVGKFGVSQKYDYDDINTQLEAADIASDAHTLKRAGQNILSSIFYGGDLITDFFQGPGIKLGKAGYDKLFPKLDEVAEVTPGIANTLRRRVAELTPEETRAYIDWVHSPNIEAMETGGWPDYPEDNWIDSTYDWVRGLFKDDTNLLGEGSSEPTPNPYD